MAEVLRQAQKYINLEQELEVEQLREATNFYQRTSDDSKKKEEAKRS